MPVITCRNTTILSISLQIQPKKRHHPHYSLAPTSYTHPSENPPAIMSKQVSLMSPTLLLLLLAAAAVCCSLTAVSGLGGGMVGGRTQVKDVKTNQEVQDLGRYSVKQFNRMQKAKKNGGYVGDLRFQEVVSAETQVVSGVKYYLKISAVTPAGVPKTFDAVVVVKPWTRSKELLNFDPSPPSY